MSPRNTLRITIAALLAAAGATALADAPAAPDTSNWKCEACPFFKGYDADATLGGIYPDGANASYGSYTGLDKSKAYVDADAHGDWRNDKGDYARYELDDLGLDSRTGRVTFGQDGRYSVALSYAGLPHSIYDATVTPFVSAGSPSLPSGWVPAGSTAGMTELAASLHDVDIGTVRKKAGLEARGVLGNGFSVFGSVTHETKRGTEITGMAFLVQTSQVATAIDYETDTVEAGVAWSSRTASLRFALNDSKFKDAWSSMGIQNPYLPLVPSATYGVRALPPDNEARQASLTGSIAMPLNTSASVALSYGQLRQDEALLPTSTLPGATVPGSFDGKINVGHYAATLGSRPLAGLSLHGRIAYDERTDDSPPLTLTQVTTDVAPGAAVTTPRYSYDRLRLDGGADYRVLKWLTIGIAGDQLNVDRTNQVAKRTEDGRAYGRIKLAPLAGLSITLKGGVAHRDAKDIDLALLPPNENPLLSIFYLSNRDRDFGELEATWTPTETVSVGLQGLMANDDYRRSTLGLLSGRERRLGGTLGWTPKESLSFYADGGYQKRETLQAGQFSTGSALWQAEIKDDYWNAGIGGRYTVNRWALSADYAHAISAGDTGVGSVGLLGAYPQLRTRYDSAGLTVGYSVSKPLKIRLRYVYQNFVTDDWALDNVGPATIANLVSLAAPAAAYNVNLFALSFTYRFGSAAAPASQE
ncbi:MAG TPA: MtrB/PioB family decaheme-associated outer membrane protein [Steroidobacteraceae bacterium]|nr:MtrB/PioB family decaheme-associated outer membrane protein [Steroidobacteraceae bacterium]